MLDDGSGVDAGVPRQRRTEEEPAQGLIGAFGRQLKLLRIRAGMERAELGRQVGYPADTIASYEQERRVPQPRFIEQADEVLGAGGLLVAMKGEIGRAQYPAFFRDMARLEEDAVSLHVYAALAVPGLLQTEDYARAVFAMRRPLLDEATVEQRVSARLARQEIFARSPLPTLSFVIEEAVLCRPLGGVSTHRGQLEQTLLHGQ